MLETLNNTVFPTFERVRMILSDLIKNSWNIVDMTFLLKKQINEAARRKCFPPTMFSLEDSLLP